MLRCPKPRRNSPINKCWHKLLTITALVNEDRRRLDVTVDQACLVNRNQSIAKLYPKSDDLGFSDPGCFGGEIATPALDALAARGVLFEDCFSSSNITIPSHVALFTGMTPRDTGVINNRMRLTEDARTLARAVVKDVAAGKVDVLIGTHRLLSRDVKFKDLGLLIVDEEQRFGVKHKERLKELRKLVDVMTLSATPIPRTVAMTVFLSSLIGIPPLGGWFAKFNAFKAVLDAQNNWAYALASIAAVNTVISAAYYMKVLRVVWMDDAPDGDTTPIVTPSPIMAALALTVIGTIAVGVYPRLVAGFGELQDLTGAVLP